MKSWKTLICVVLCFMLLSCSCTKSGESNAESYLNVVTSTVIDAVPMDADGIAAAELDVSVFYDIRESMKNESGEAFDAVEEILKQPYDYDVQNKDKWTNVCYVSDVVIPYYLMHDGDFSDSYTLFAFSEDFSYCMEISLIYTDDGYSWSVSAEGENKILKLLKANMNMKYMFINNGGLIALDSTNTISVLYTLIDEKENDHTITGDVYSALGGDDLAISWAELINDDNLHCISIS